MSSVFFNFFINLLKKAIFHGFYINIINILVNFIDFYKYFIILDALLTQK